LGGDAAGEERFLASLGMTVLFGGAKKISGGAGIGGGEMNGFAGWWHGH